MKPIVLIAAMDAARAIGRGNDIPWHIPGEQKRFKELTMGKALIMGRMTYASLPRPLPGRHCIVLSRSTTNDIPKIHSAASVEEALSLASGLPGSEIIIGGGQQVYELFLPLADRIHLTLLDATFGGDRHFPPIPNDEFAISESEQVDGPVPYKCLTFVRRAGFQHSPC
ncbi:dihydrofolate reductase [Ensifer sesbaniae]|uniref:dihydrofolate reductase n=1 Tax=Ensifer sesbaniae TaxID=1214071 RepID=UPI002000BA0E|nr:dihydrofolate reductase [Ensifer sesbaniae]